MVDQAGHIAMGGSKTTHASTSRDLVMAVMYRGNFDFIAPFVLSLKNTGFRGSTVVFTNDVDRESIEQLRGCGVTVVPFTFLGRKGRQHLARVWPFWRRIFSARLPLAVKRRLAHCVFHLRYRRYLLYLDFLEKHAADFDRVFLADCRDVYFQADPFAWPWTSGVHFFLDETGRQMGDCTSHRQWLSRQFGQSFFERYMERTPTCSGTTYGDIAGIRQYLSLMVATTMQALNLGEKGFGDQGIHNYLFFQKLMDNMTAHENRHGPVMTMFWVRECDIPIDGSGAVVNHDGGIVPVLHQYDRFLGLKARLLGRL